MLDLRGSSLPGDHALTPELSKLLEAAREARLRAYAPYSNFHVGAAVLSDDGRIVIGANVENVSYGLTLCAERNAVTRAVIDKPCRIRAVAVCADALVSPCGACRQVLSEFADTECLVVMGSKDPDQAPRVASMASLLPFAFDTELAKPGKT